MVAKVVGCYETIDFRRQVRYIYISFSHNPVRKVELGKRRGGRVMLYLRCPDEPPFGEAPDDDDADDAEASSGSAAPSGGKS